MELSFTPSIDPQETRRRLDRLLVPGALQEPELDRRIERLAAEFRSFAGHYPLPLWAPGLILTGEMRGLSEALFPLSRVRSCFELLLARGCRFRPLLSGSYLYSCASWFDLLHRFRPGLRHADPAAILRELARDPEQRLRFLFALLLPHHFGGGFDRYPGQSEWLRGWLRDNVGRLSGGIRALDSACGSGEGTYGLAELIAGAGYGVEGCAVHGSTLEPIELFAAAHACFPHDPARAAVYRERIAPLLAQGKGLGMEFYLDEVGSAGSRQGYHLVLCNGLLGGPLLHEPDQLAGAFGALASRLLPGGVLLAADRFHAGWRLQVPESQLRALMRAHGLEPIAVPEGIGGRKRGKLST
jgi:SAM-dependent methyltransferase